jgi:tetratricopeptide (TPR) repeat protein
MQLCAHRKLYGGSSQCIGVHNRIKYKLLFFAIILVNNQIISQYKKEINQVIKNYSLAKSDSDKVKLLNELAEYYRENDNQKSLVVSLRALSLCDSIGFKRGFWKAYNNVGEAHKYLGNFKEALGYHQKALKFAEEKNNQKLIGHSYNNLAIIVKKNNNLDLAKIYFEKSLAAYRTANFKMGLYTSFNNLGNLFHRQSNEPKAYHYLLQAYKIANELKDSSIICQSLTNLGNVLYDLKKIDSSTFCYYKSYQISLKHASKREFINAGCNLAAIYYEDKKFYMAQKLFDSLIICARQLNDKQIMSQLYSGIGSMHYANENYKLAYLYKDSLRQIENELYDINTTESINELTAVFENEKKELLIKNQSLEIASKEKQNQQKTNIIIFGAIALFATGFFAALAFLNYRKTKKANMVIEKQKKEAEEQKGLIELKQKEILDSMRYAQRIQKALMPNEKQIQASINKGK